MLKFQKMARFVHFSLLHMTWSALKEVTSISFGLGKGSGKVSIIQKLGKEKYWVRPCTDSLGFRDIAFHPFLYPSIHYSLVIFIAVTKELDLFIFKTS